MFCNWKSVFIPKIISRATNVPQSHERSRTKLSSKYNNLQHLIHDDFGSSVIPNISKNVLNFALKSHLEIINL